MFYSNSDKLIYTAPHGRPYDPLALQRKLLLASTGTLNDLLATWSAAESTDLDRAAAEESLVAITRSAFDLQPFDTEGGVTDRIALNCLTDFLEWLAKKV